MFIVYSRDIIYMIYSPILLNNIKPPQGVSTFGNKNSNTTRDNKFFKYCICAVYIQRSTCTYNLFDVDAYTFHFT